MATFQATVPLLSDTDANFRLWGKMVNDAFTAFGWTKTSDTGQIDWTTVLKPATTATVQGYEIWKAGDALAATNPIFIKIEYASGSSNVTNAALFLTVGTGSNGAGTITGFSVARTQLRSSNTSAVAQVHLFSGTSSRITACIGYGYNTVSAIMLFTVERTRDTSGAENAEGFVVALGSSAITQSFQFISYVGGAGPACPHWPTYIPPQGGSSGSSIALFPFYPSKGIFLNPIIGLMGYVNATIADGATPSLALYGSNRNYLALGARASIGTFLGGASSPTLLMLAE